VFIYATLIIGSAASFKLRRWCASAIELALIGIKEALHAEGLGIVVAVLATFTPDPASDNCYGERIAPELGGLNRYGPVQPRLGG